MYPVVFIAFELVLMIKSLRDRSLVLFFLKLSLREVFNKLVAFTTTTYSFMKPICVQGFIGYGHLTSNDKALLKHLQGYPRDLALRESPSLE